MLRIVHVMRSPVGGLFRHVCDIARLQAADGHLVGVVCDTQTGGPGAEKILTDLSSALRLGVHRIPISRNPGPTDALALMAVTRIIKKSKADIIHGHGAKGGALSRLAGMILKHRPAGQSAACFYTPHGGALHYEATSRAGRLFFRFERFAARHTNAILFESAFGRDAFIEKIGAPPCPVDVIHNGLSDAELLPVAQVPDPYDLLFIGEFRHLKGIDVLLRAVARLKERGRPLRLLCVGAGEEEGVYRHMIRDLGIGDCVHFSPPMPARSAFSHARAVVVPSRAESLPYVVLEACGASLPVIATRVGGIPEIFGAYSGELIAPSDTAALVAAIETAFDDWPAMERRATALAGRMASVFRLDAMHSAITAAYATHGALAPAKRMAALTPA